MAMRYSRHGAGGGSSFGAKTRRVFPVVLLAAVLVLVAFPRLATAGGCRQAGAARLRGSTGAAHRMGDVNASLRPASTIRPARIPLKDVSIQPGGLS
jgi:hypothetical protein